MHRIGIDLKKQFWGS
jgi:hypothetical protein